ncbi:hypothetical protein ACFQ0O_19390 [Saccharopolyspora spinosporotrichia]
MTATATADPFSGTTRHVVASSSAVSSRSTGVATSSSRGRTRSARVKKSRPTRYRPCSSLETKFCLVSAISSR